MVGQLDAEDTDIRLEEQIEEGHLRRPGEADGGGSETLACGGMHTLLVDEAGNVSLEGGIQLISGPIVGHQRQRCAGPSHHERS